MPITATAFPGFGGGLDLRDQPDLQNPSAAIDCLNVMFTERGAVKQRDGYGKLTAAEGANRYDSLTEYVTTGGINQLVAGAGARLEAISAAGAVAASSTAPSTGPHSFARFGGPTQQVVFCANGADQLRRWDGTSFMTPTWTGTAPTGRFVAVTPWDNRLVNARRTGATAGDSPSTVRFSGKGDPLTWGANDYVEVSPGDGEAITAMAAYEDKLLVFKETKFFVFYYTAADGAGQPIFQYRTVANQTGCSAARGVTVGRDGVYFINRRGIYRTTGGPPFLVSELLDPIFYGQPSDFYLGGVINQAAIGQAALGWHREQLYAAIPTGSSTVNNRVLVFDPRVPWWSIHDLPVSALCQFRPADQTELLFAYSSGLKHIGRHAPAYADDDGQTITSRWRSGWIDFGTTTVKTLRECKVWGKGSVRFGVGRDYTPAENVKPLNLAGKIDLWGDGTDPTDLWQDGTSLTDVWDVGQSVRPKSYRSAVRGTVFSIEVSNNASSSWAMYRLAPALRGQRHPSVVRTEA